MNIPIPNARAANQLEKRVFLDRKGSGPQKAFRETITPVELTRADRILLHLRCLCHNHKYRWHLAGIWRELRPSKRNHKILPAAA